ncbi:MAG: alkaline phosphatase family protein [Candidatus Sulfopaludibacter sp.]|nr:alkaline phosphatase family protein [Candidatus Sulfopaludibacter sp.]
MGICRREFVSGLLAGLAARHLAGAVRPKLLVILVLEQFRPDYVDSLMPQMTAGGFRKLLDKSAWFPDCRHLASGFTSTALATLTTGAWPAQHGIVADSWYERATKTRVHASDEALLAGTLMSEAAESSCNVSAVALNPMHARLFAGTQKADFYWMDDRGQFQTNGDAPFWLQPYNDRKSIEKLHDARWVVPGVRADAPALRTLTYDPKHPEQFLALYKASPFAQDTLFDFVGELITAEGLGQKNSQDVLCVIESSTELLGYETGARNPLMEQLVLHLDRRLEALLTQLTRSHGDAGFNLAVMGAHGAPDAPAAGTRARMAVDGEALARKIDTALAARGLGRVEKFLYPFLYLDSAGFRDAEEIRKAAGHALLDQPPVADFFTAEGASSAKNGWLGRLRNSFHSRRSGDLMVSYQPGYVENFGQSWGISYGSLYNYDVRVPLCFYGPQFRPGIFDRTVEAVDVAPTLARALGVADPSSSMGRVLAEALA